MQPPQVRVHVNHKPYEVASPTTGAELYARLGIREGYLLFKEDPEAVEDHLVRHEARHVHLVNDERFHTSVLPNHLCLIYVNGTPHFISNDDVSYEEVVHLAFPALPKRPAMDCVVQYDHAKCVPHHGTMAKDQAVAIRRHGTHFDVGHGLGG